MQSTEREVPKTFLAALNHLGATFILMFSMTLELIVLVVIRIGNRIEGSANSKGETAADIAQPTAVPPRRKAKAMKAPASTVVDEEFERAMAAATQYEWATSADRLALVPRTTNKCSHALATQPSRFQRSG